MVEAPKYLAADLEKAKLQVLSGDIGETVIHGASTQTYFLDKDFTSEKLAREAIAAFPKGSVKPDPTPWKGGYAIQLLKIDFTEAEKQQIKRALADARTRDNNRAESVAGFTSEFTAALSAKSVDLTKNQERLSSAEFFELELTKPFEYKHHADAAIRGLDSTLAKVEPVQVEEDGEKRTKYRVVFDAEPLREAKVNKGQAWFDARVDAVAGAYNAEAEEIKKRTERSKAILEAFGDKETQPTHRLFDINNTGFDKRANAQAVASALGGAEVVEGKNGAKFYIRVTNSLAVTDDNLNKAVALAQQKREQEQKLLADFGSLIGEEFVPYEPTDEVRKANVSVGYRYRVKAGYANKDYVDLAHKAFGQFDSSMVKVVQEGDERVLLLNASLLKPEMLGTIRTETKAAILAARTKQNEADKSHRQQEAAQELRSAIATTQDALKDYSPTQEANGVAFRPGITDATKLAKLVGALNEGITDDAKKFATVTGEGKEAVVTLNMQNRPTDFADRVVAAKGAIEGELRDQTFAELTEAFKPTGANIERVGTGYAISNIPTEIEADIASKLHIRTSDMNIDGRIPMDDLLHIPRSNGKADVVAAASVLRTYEANLAVEEERKAEEERLAAERKEKTEKLQVLSDTPIVPKADAPGLVSVFFRTPAEAQAVAKALGDEGVAKIPDPNNPSVVEVNLDALEVSKIDAAKTAQDAAREAQEAAAKQEADEKAAADAKRAKEEAEKRRSRDQTNMWINLGGPILGAVAGLFLGGGFTLGGIISAVAVGAAAWLGTQAFTETGLFAKSDPNASSSPAATANGTSPQVSSPEQQQEQEQGETLPNGTQVAPLSTPTVEPTTPAPSASPGR